MIKKSTSPSTPDSITSDGISHDVLPDLVGYHLRQAQVEVFDHFTRHIARDMATPGQFGVLTLIGANPGLNQSTLAKVVGIERSTMVAVIDALENRGLVERRRSSVDRRSYALVLSDAGQALLAELKAMVDAHERKILADFSDDEKSTLIDFLRRLRAAC